MPSHSLRNLFYRNTVHAMQIVDIDIISLQAVKGAFQMIADRFIYAANTEPAKHQLCCNNDVLTNILQGLACDQLIPTSDTSISLSILFFMNFLHH